MKNWLATMLVTMLFIAASAWSQDNPTGSPQHSGFLSDYSKLQPAADREGIWLFVNKTADYSGYKKIMFDPIEVYLTPNPDYKGVQPDVLKRMTDGFYASFLSALTPDYQIVHEAGPDVLLIRAAITGVQLAKPPLEPTDFIPVKAVYNLGKSLAGNAQMVAEMTAEMEVLDPNGKRLAAAVANRKGSKTLKQGDQVTWADLQAITDYWAKGFRQRLDQLRDVDH
jgi:hypothetical protein